MDKEGPQAGLTLDTKWPVASDQRTWQTDRPTHFLHPHPHSHPDPMAAGRGLVLADLGDRVDGLSANYDPAPPGILDGMAGGWRSRRWCSSLARSVALPTMRLAHRTLTGPATPPSLSPPPPQPSLSALASIPAHQSARNWPPGSFASSHKNNPTRTRRP